MADVSSNPFTEALHAGLSPIPVDTTTKRPKVTWKTYQEAPAEALIAQGWGTENIGVVCGSVSGRLICLDIEGAFDQATEAAEALSAAGMSECFAAWCDGYLESTPSGGRHVLVRLEGDGPIEGNRKLVSDTTGKTLIETRGEGGYVIVAPSRNGETGWNLLRGGFETIAYATLAEWEAVVGALITLDHPRPPTPTVESRSTPSLPPMLRGEGWVDAALTSLPQLRTVLSSHGWEPDGSFDSYGEHWTRPGKDIRLGCSASISNNDRLFVHSTNAGLPTGLPSLDALDVILAYDLGRRPSPDERVSYLRQFRPDRPGGEAIDGRVGPAGGPTNPSLYLPEAFWTARPWLERVRAASMRRMISPDAVLGALLSAYATTIPMGIRIPAIVGQWAPLNLYSVLVSRSGGGKTSAMGLADQLLGWSPQINPDVLFRSLRSGEGLINIATKKAKKGEEPSDGPTYRVGIQIAFDEGGVLSRQTERSGSTTIPYLNTAWAGHGMVGGAKADQEGYFPANLVRVCAVIGVQFGAAANLFTGESQILGFPQRLTFFGLDHPDLLQIRRVDSDYSPVEALGLPWWSHAEYTRFPHEMVVPETIADQVWSWTQSKHGDSPPSTLDGHKMNLQLRISAVLALMDGRGDIDVSDWDLASDIVATSCSLREHLLASLGDAVIERARTAGKADALRQIEREDIFMEKAALSLARRVAKIDYPLNKREVKSYLSSYRRRYAIDYRDVIALAISRGWVISTGEQEFVVGPVKVGGSGGS